MRDAKHDGSISKATFAKIQDRITGRANAPARKDLHEDFPLRGAGCSGCGNKLTASWSKGLTKQYPYYLCQNRNAGGTGEKCEFYGKVISRAKVEREFEELLRDIQPSHDLVKATIAAAPIYWNRKVNQSRENAAVIHEEIKRADAQIEKLVNRIVEATNDRAIGALEGKLGELEQRKLVLTEQAANSTAPRPTFNESLELSRKFLANPCNIWISGIFELKRLVLGFVFPEALEYHRKSGYRTPKTSISFSALGGSGMFLPD